MEQQSTSWSERLLSFSLDIFTYQLDFSVLTIESSASIHWLTDLTNLFLSLSLFLVLFWIIWMLVTVHKPCHVPHASQITNWRTIFKERPFLVSKEWDRSWSRAFLIAYHKTFIKKFLAVRPEKVTRSIKTKKKLERQLQSFLC